VSLEALQDIENSAQWKIQIIYTRIDESVVELEAKKVIEQLVQGMYEELVLDFQWKALQETLLPIVTTQDIEPSEETQAEGQWRSFLETIIPENWSVEDEVFTWKSEVEIPTGNVAFRLFLPEGEQEEIKVFQGKIEKYIVNQAANVDMEVTFDIISLLNFNITKPE
jgi:hypothetical protein